MYRFRQRRAARSSKAPRVLPSIPQTPGMPFLKVYAETVAGDVFDVDRGEQSCP